MKCKKRYLFFGIVFFIFTLIQGICLIFRGDDLVWYSLDKIDEYRKWINPNGRYFTNAITYIMVRSDWLRILFYCLFLCAFLILILCLADYRKKHTKFCVGIISTLLILAPTIMYASVFNWVSGFTNYVISFVFTLLYMLFCNRIYDNDIEIKPIYSVFTFLIGFVGAFCVEHISFYNIVFGIFIIIFTRIKYKKAYAVHIAFLIASVSGFAIMLMNPNYGIVFHNAEDAIGERFIQTSFSDIFSNVFIYFLPSFVKPYVALNIAFTIIIYLFYLKHKSENGGENNLKYGRCCLAIVSSYTVYSMFSTYFNEFLVLSPAMKLQAFETAFLFIYLVSLVYFLCVFLEGSARIRAIIYMTSSVVVVAPFLIVNPITPRCFVASYVFMILALVEMYIYYNESYSDTFIEKISSVFISMATTLACIMCYINISNFYSERTRVKYIRQQIEEGSDRIAVISLYYTDYAFDFHNFFKDNPEDKFVDFEELYFLYYDIDVSYKDYDFYNITMYDYELITSE